MRLVAAPLMHGLPRLLYPRRWGRLGSGRLRRRHADFRSRPGCFTLRHCLRHRAWRNRLDGSVEALAHGPAPAVQALIDWAHRGPELARVEGVHATPVQADAPLAGFEQRETV